MSGASEATTVLLKKRERTQNWIPEEKSALFALIKHHVGAIENKKIDAAASATKSLAWQQIYHAFRGRFSADRDITRIREQWRRMKAQARMEMYTYAEKVRSLGPEVAAKSRPSNLSIEVWRLMESVRKNDCEAADRSDDSSQDNENPTSRMSIHAILDKLTLPTDTSGSEQEIKIEINSDSEDENSHAAEPSNVRNEPSGDWNDGGGPAAATCDKNESVQRETWIFKSTQREHELKLRMLHIELERAELQKQTAINELKTSELKKKLMQDQVDEYYSQVRMAGERGSGAGKGGGGGGTIRDAGGSFGKMEAAHEDQYFYNLQKEQLKKMRESLHDEISFHEEQIKRHQEAINRHKKRITDMEQKE
ncbi:uncharacterized protein LOC105200382 isoform X2 [Solenopsis invicta]|uniref:uncharacterized protein LOC105200382 isoform X2 n=1 Tax=Solenopsis invicta TaxID=13686 RepID=UPI0005962741|nr:uncharacterized protein LOC105200382 isoform X2 [Solenopsis invicta]